MTRPALHRLVLSLATLTIACGDDSLRASPLPLIAVAPDSLDFGSVRPGLSQTRQLAVSNEGGGTLHLHAARITEDERGAFLLDEVPAQVAAGSRVVLTFTYAAPAEGADGATLVLESDSNMQASYRVALAGRTLAPCAAGGLDCDGTCVDPQRDPQHCGQCGHACGSGLECLRAACAAPTCQDQARNGDESDVDCGGACPPCVAGARCRAADDCASRRCVEGRCAAPSCTDGVRNGSETDVDCGGCAGCEHGCPACLEGSACTSDAACASGLCLGSRCAARPTLALAARASALEGSPVVLTATLSRPLGAEVTFAWSTRDGTALAGLDYATEARTATLAPGQTSTTLSVATLTRPLYQGARAFTVVVESATNATLANASATATILESAAVPPSSLAYAPDTLVCTRARPCALGAPTSSGGPVVSFAVSPAPPAGLTFGTATGALSGTPAEASPATPYLVTATNSGGSASARFTLTVVPAPAISPAQANVVVGETQAFSVTGGLAPYAYAVVAGGGSCSGATYTAPATPGAATVRATDALGNTSDAAVNVLESLTIGPSSVTLAVTDTQLFGASGGAGGYLFSVASGLGSMNGSTYLAPATAGSASVRVADARGATATAQVTINPALALAPAAVTLGPGGLQAFTATGGVPPYLFSVTSGGGSLAGGRYTAPSAKGSATVQVQDSRGHTSTASVTIAGPPPAPVLTATSPASPSTSTTPTVSGTAQADATVRLYTTADCTGPEAGTATASAGGIFSIATSVASGSATSLRATATDAFGTSPCSAPLVYVHTRAPVIITIGGNGTGGYSGEGGPATSAPVTPNDVAVDPSGNVYFGDTTNYRLRRISPAGLITTVAGDGTLAYSGDGGPATAARVGSIWGVGTDAHGNVFFTDMTTYFRVRRVSPDGIITTVAGGGASNAEGVPATSAALAGPTDVAAGPDGSLYIVERMRYRVRRVTPDGLIRTFAGTGTAIHSGDGGQATSAGLLDPETIAVDGAGNVFICDRGDRIRKVTPAGIISTVAGSGVRGGGGDGGPATSAQLYGPWGVAVDASGVLYISDSWNHRIRKVENGLISTVAGTGTQGFSGDGGPPTAARLAAPYGVAVDAGGNLYIADLYNSRLRKVVR